MEAGRLRLSGKEPKIREVAPETDPALAAICDRALALDPEQRFASAAELRGELQAQLEKRGSHGRRVMVERLEEACARERQHLHGLIGTEMSRMHTSSRSPIARVEAPRSESSESSAITVPNASIQPSKWHLRALATAGMLALGVCVGLAARWTRARAPVMSTSPPISLSVTAPPSPVPALPGEGVVVPPPASPLAEETRPVPVVPSPPSPAPSEARPDSLSPTRTGRTRRPAPATTVVRVAEHVATPPTRARASAVASRSTGASRSPMEQPSATVQPGTHLVRPAKPVHCCLYEKDPYSP